MCLETENVGDGYCDDIANTQICNWDGGDCCPRKCSDDERLIFYERPYCPCIYAWNTHCTFPLIDECKCLDPNIDADSCIDGNGK